MGEQADYVTESMMDSDDDWYDGTQFHKTCKYCNVNDLLWTRTSAGWRLAELNGDVHACDKYKEVK